MPQIPRGLDRAIPQSRRAISHYDATGAADGALAASETRASGARSLAAGLAGAATSMQRAQDSVNELEYTKAQAGFTKDIIDQQSALDADPDWGTHSKRFHDGVGRSRAGWAATITDPGLRRQFETQTELDMARGAAVIRSRAFNLEAQDGLKTLDNATANALESYVAAPDDVARGQVARTWGANVAAAVRAGYISEPYAVERRRKFAEEAAVGFVGKFGARKQLAMLTGADGSVPLGPAYVVGQPEGLLKAGNIDLNKRPVVPNADGSISTVRSMSYRNDAGQEVLIPTVSDEGKILSDREAIKYWSQKGQNLGTFDSPDAATAYALSLHDQQASTYGKDGVGRAVLLPPEVQKAIQAAAPNDADATILGRIAQLESKGDKSAVNPDSGAAGVFQFVSKTAAQYGLGDPSDVKASARAAAKLLSDNRTALRAALGHEPTPAELYLAHQQGAGGAAALIANPDKTAIEVLTGVYGSAAKARDAILLNGGEEVMTAGEFADLWKVRYYGGSNASIDAAMNLLPGEKPEGGWNFAPTGTAVDAIPHGRREQMIDALLGEVRQQRTAARAALQGEISLTYDDAKTNAFLDGQVDQGFAAKLMAAYPGADGAAKVKALKESAALGRDNNQIKGNAWSQDDSLLLKAAADVQAGDRSAFAVERYQRLAKVIADKREWLAKDPAGYVQANNPAVAQAWQAALDKGAEAVDLRLAVNLTRAEQRRLGVPEDHIRLLPDGLVQPLADRIGEAKTPAEQMAAITALASPKDKETSALILSELGQHAGDDGARYALVGGLALDGPEGQKLGLDILAGMDAVKSGAVKMPKGEDLLTAVDEKLGSALSFNPQARAAIVDAAAVIYANDALKSGTAAEEFDADKFGKAIDRVTGGVIEFNDADIVVPRRGMDEDEFEDLMNRLTVADIGGSLPIAADGSEISLDDIRDGNLQNVGDGAYLVSVAGFPVIDPRTQQPFILDLRGLEPKVPTIGAPRAIGKAY